MAVTTLTNTVCPSYSNCLFRALGDQLEGHSRGHLRLRQETVQYMMSHRQDFEPFVEDDVPFTQHCKEMAQYDRNQILFACENVVGCPSF